MLTMPAFRGLHPNDSGSAKPFCLLRPACGSATASCSTKTWRSQHHDGCSHRSLPFLITRKNESIIMICSLPLLLNHPPITVEIPACWDSCRIETASFEKTFQLLSQRVNMNLPKNLLFKNQIASIASYPPTAFCRHAENASGWVGFGLSLERAVWPGESLFTYIHLRSSKHLAATERGFGTKLEVWRNNIETWACPIAQSISFLWQSLSRQGL